jgi:CTP synthase
MTRQKYIFVAGGVMSGVGKGIATASIGKILQSKGFKVTAIKIDPYINVDAGTMNPIEHGEIFVTDDGTECDQDLGNYERFLDETLTSDNYLTTGRVYQAVINKERKLGYHGRCVEVVPDIPNEVITRIKKVAKKTKADFILIEIGGTVGEYQNSLFLEAARMLKILEPNNVLFIFISYLPIPENIGEMKTKPTQTSVRLLNEAGIQPDIILGRSSLPLDALRKKKLSISCSVVKENIISAPDVKSIYEIPINFEKEHLGNQILKKFGLKAKTHQFKNWQNLVKTIKSNKKIVKIGIVGKYFESGQFILLDSYLSVIEAIKHAAWYFKFEPDIYWLSSANYEGKNSIKCLKELKNYDGIIVPGGFGPRGINGKINAIKFCRENKIPYLGLCLGMQLAVIEFARNVCHLKNANSTEFVTKKIQYPIIDIMPEQKKLLRIKAYGGTMRLGAYSCQISPNTISAKAYNLLEVSERHRHRYELNNNFREILEQHNMVIAGINPKSNLVEIIELKNHPFFVGVQFHPEYKSRPLNPHPLFKEFIKSAIRKHHHN